jgi:ATP synthase I subunit
MNEAENCAGPAFPASGDEALHARIFRNMAATIALAVIVSVPLAPWRVTTGLLLGGLLSLFNHRWMRTSIAAALSPSLEGVRRIGITRYILRYFVIGALVYALYQLDIALLPATIAGLCSFVVALFVEAFRRIYLVVIHREEIN